MGSLLQKCGHWASLYCLQKDTVTATACKCNVELYKKEQLSSFWLGETMLNVKSDSIRPTIAFSPAGLHEMCPAKFEALLRRTVQYMGFLVANLTKITGKSLVFQVLPLRMKARSGTRNPVWPKPRERQMYSENLPSQASLKITHQ